jgi:hypothetical protein
MCMVVCRHLGTGAVASIVWVHLGMVTRMASARDPIPDHEQKKVALSYLNEAWAEARLEGIDGDCMAQACLFVALMEFVSTYGEDAAARYAEGFANRIRNGEFSTDLPRQ